MPIRPIAALLAAAALQSPPPALAPSEANAVARASQRGAAIYAYDQAAWHGTDDMRAKLPDYANKLGGYVADGPPEAPRLVFFDKSRSKAVYIARFSGGHLVEGKVLGATDDTALTPIDRRMIDALGIARAALVVD